MVSAKTREVLAAEQAAAAAAAPRQVASPLRTATAAKAAKHSHSPRASPGTMSSSTSSFSVTSSAVDAMQQTKDIMFGKKSLQQRFGNLKGKELQEKIFEVYQALWRWLF
jgi:hypothetical protein